LKPNDQFTLKDSFIAKYANVKPPFGFNGLGELVYQRTYSRLKADGTNEKWFETVRRVVEGTYRMQQRHIISQDLGWSDARAQKSAQEMFDRMFWMKFLPPGRGLWAMGSAIVEERGLYAALNNCGFTSTENIDKELAEPFCFLMDASMLGVGVGFDTLGAGKLTIQVPKWDEAQLGESYSVPDTREGWVESVRKLLNSYFTGDWGLNFDYDEVRAAGLPIKGFGGTSSGPQPLIDLHTKLREVLDRNVGKPITITTIVDIMNLIGVCVVAGNVRRTAEIVFGPADSEEYIGLKDYKWNGKEYAGPRAYRAAYGWTSNNSIFAELGNDYNRVSERIANNGEPGIFWLETARAYSRTNSLPDWRDKKAKGGNPCLEQTLEDGELCCLVETFPNRHDNLDDFKRTLKFAYLYAKTVTLGKTHWPKTNRVLLRNRRIGTSMSGIAQFIAHRGLHELKKWCEAGYTAIQEYDKRYSDWFTVPRSIKTTSIKPSGSVSLLAGATPGCHDPEDTYYLRRMRLGIHSSLIRFLIEAGYHVEPAVDDPSNTVVVEVPCCVDESIPTVKDTTLWEKAARAAFLQRYWADNQVSCTAAFAKQEEDQIENVLNYFQYDLKGISFLPITEAGSYAQMPYEAISKEEYKRRIAMLKPLDLSNLSEDSTPERGCDSSSCTI
jgi:ribonucleoside-triphosphate reductase